MQNQKKILFDMRLSDRCINKTRNKKTFATTFVAYQIKLEVTVTKDYIEEKDEIKRNYEAKVVLKNGLVSLTSPLQLID